MKKLSLALFAISMMAMASLAQGKANYSGVWKLDAAKSTFEGPMRVDSITLTVAQTAKDLKVDTESKRNPPASMPAGAGQPPTNMPPGAGQPPMGGPPAGGPPRGFGGRGFGMMGDGSVTYSLEGKETKVEMDGPNGKIPVIYKAAVETDGSLKLSNTRSFTGPMGEITTTVKETWKLSADGTTLTVDREATTPRGAQTSKLVFVKG